MDEISDEMQDIRQRPPKRRVGPRVLYLPKHQALSSVPAPFPLARTVTTATARIRPPRSRALSSLLVLLLVVIANMGMQLDRRALDVASDTSWALRRVARCESLGRVPDVLYVGSSRTVYAADAALIDRLMRQRGGPDTLGCNAGVFGATFEEDYYTLKRFFEDGYAPKLIVETIWEFNLNDHARSPADGLPSALRRIQAVADLADLPALRPELDTQPETASASRTLDFALAKLLPMYGDREGLLQRVCVVQSLSQCAAHTSAVGSLDQRRYQSADRQGFVAVTDESLAAPYPDGPADWPAAERAYLARYNYDFHIGGTQPQWLARLIALANSRRVPVVLIATPLHSLYFRYALGRPGDWPAIIGYLRAFAATHGVAFYDESQAPGYGDGDFWEPSHLNASGARKFSTWLAVVVKLALGLRAAR